ncbi:hypothetical protein ACOMHN_000590 [Nucella lapillus]
MQNIQVCGITINVQTSRSVASPSMSDLQVCDITSGMGGEETPNVSTSGAEAYRKDHGFTEIALASVTVRSSSADRPDIAHCGPQGFKAPCYDRAGLVLHYSR